MIFLVRSADGLRDARGRAQLDDAIWCGQDAITPDDFAALRNERLTRLMYALEDATAIERALASIAEHHPGEAVWVEPAPSA